MAQENYRHILTTRHPTSWTWFHTCGFYFEEFAASWLGWPKEEVRCWFNHIYFYFEGGSPLCEMAILSYCTCGIQSTLFIIVWLYPLELVGGISIFCIGGKRLIIILFGGCWDLHLYKEPPPHCIFVGKYWRKKFLHLCTSLGWFYCILCWGFFVNGTPLWTPFSCRFMEEKGNTRP